MSKNRLTLLRAVHKLAEKSRATQEVEDGDVKDFVKRSYVLGVGAGIAVVCHYVFI